MILYYTIKGNSKKVAEEIAQASSDQIMSIEDAVAREMYKFENMDTLGLVVPEYKDGMPQIVNDFLKKLIPLHINYTYLIVTYEVSSGVSTSIAQDFMKAKGKKFDALFGINTLEELEPQVKVCRKYIARQSKGDFVPQTEKKGFLTKLFHRD